jgi:hypothetical protein
MVEFVSWQKPYVYRGQVFPVVERNTEEIVRYNITVDVETPAWIFSSAEARAFNVDLLSMTTDKIKAWIEYRHPLNIFEHMTQNPLRNMASKKLRAFFILIMWAGSSLTAGFCVNRFTFFRIFCTPSAPLFTPTLFTDVITIFPPRWLPVLVVQFDATSPARWI